MGSLKAPELVSSLSPSSRFRVILLHGADRSAVTQLTGTILRKLTKKGATAALTRLTEQQITGSPELVFESYARLPLFEDQEFVVISGSGDALTKSVEPVLSSDIVGNTLIIEAEALTKSSKLRKVMEASPNALACALYEETLHELRFRLERQIRGEKFDISADALAYLADSLSHERGIGSGEVEKLLTYMGPERRIALEDVQAICADSHESSVDQLVDMIFEGQLTEIERHMTALQSQGSALKSFLPLAQMHVSKLQTLALQHRQGSSVTEILAAPRNGVFFKRRSSFAHQLKIWPLEKLIDAEQKIAETTLQTRLRPDLEEALLSRTCLALGWQARSLMA